MKAYTNDRVTMWWHTKGTLLPLLFNVEIFRLMFRRKYDPAKDDAVIFKCLLPQAMGFINGLDFDDIIEVRYVADGRLDNPHAGHNIFYLRQLIRTDQWANKVKNLEYKDSQRIMVHLHARCVIDEVVLPE